MESASELQLSVRLASGNEVAAITAKTDETIRSLKKQIRLVDGTPTAQQRLLLGHAVLSNAQSLAEAGLTDGAIIQLVRMQPTEVPSPVGGTAAGDGIIILEDHVDPTYEPTEDEIDEYAEWLGMDPDADGALLWIAREGLKAPLHDPWRACETADRELFYFNFDTGQSTWDHPIDEVQRAKYRQLKAEQIAQVQPPSAPRVHAPAPRAWLSPTAGRRVVSERRSFGEDPDDEWGQSWRRESFRDSLPKSWDDLLPPARAAAKPLAGFESGSWRISSNFSSFS